MEKMSARKFMVVGFTTTYCLLNIGNLALAVLGKIQVETYLALWAGFSPLMILIGEWYFKRNDRNGQKEGV